MYENKFTTLDFENHEWTHSDRRVEGGIFARSGSQSEHRIRFILPARGASHIISNDTALWKLEKIDRAINNWQQIISLNAIL